jgi:hypothetical protein
VTMMYGFCAQGAERALTPRHMKGQRRLNAGDAQWTHLREQLAIFAGQAPAWLAYVEAAQAIGTPCRRCISA